MQAVDFTAKHDILIRHKDGVLMPMDEPYYEAEQLNQETWQIMSSGDYHYLLAAQSEAISIDTGYGAGNLREYLEGLCGLPVKKVINTHHHFDHTANNCYFELAYMAKEAVEKASIPYKSFEGVVFPRDYHIQVVKDYDIIPVDGRKLQIFRCGDHTADGIAILDRKYRILYTGDEIMDGMKTLNGSVEKWKKDLDKIAGFRSEFDTICGGFGRKDASEFDIFREAATRIWNGVESDETMPQQREPEIFLENVDGHRVYDCQLPHAEDRPQGGFFRESDTMANYVWQGRIFRYDKSRMRESD